MGVICRYTHIWVHIPAPKSYVCKSYTATYDHMSAVYESLELSHIVQHMCWQHMCQIHDSYMGSYVCRHMSATPMSICVHPYMGFHIYGSIYVVPNMCLHVCVLYMCSHICLHSYMGPYVYSYVCNHTVKKSIYPLGVLLWPIWSIWPIWTQ